MTSEELRERKRELMARKKYELELQEQGKGDNFALFMVNEELLDINAQLRALAPAGKGIKFGRKGRTSYADFSSRFNSGDRQQFIDWTRQDTKEAEEAAAGARAELARMLRDGMNSVSKRQREMLLLYADGMKMVAIAQKLGVNTSTVSKTIKRAKKNISRITDAQQAIERLRDGSQLDMSDPEVAKLLMGTLTAHQAVCFYLYYSEWLSIRQIGQLLHVDHSTICRTIQRAVTRINDVLGGVVDVLDNIEGLDDVVFAIYCGLSEQCDELPPIVRECLPDRPSIPYMARAENERGPRSEAVIPQFQIRGLPGAKHGKLEADQHGRLLQTLQERYQGTKLLWHGGNNQWAHPIARWLVRVFRTITRPFKYGSGGG